MKRIGKGQPLSINEPNRGGTSDVNAWKMRMNAVPPPEPPVFKPLVVKPHPRSEQMQEYAAIPSQYQGAA